MHDEVNSSLAALRFLITDMKQNMSEGGKVSVNVLEDLEQEAQAVYQRSRSFMHQLNSASISETYNVIELIGICSRPFWKQCKPYYTKPY